VVHAACLCLVQCLATCALPCEPGVMHSSILGRGSAEPDSGQPRRVSEPDAGQIRGATKPECLVVATMPPKYPAIHSALVGFSMPGPLLMGALLRRFV
jgi:hypothetical protein